MTTRNKMEVKIISIDGNIGSGKSYLVDELKKKCVTRDDICFLQEPVDEWQSIQDVGGENIIEKYYKNQNKYAFSFQMMAYISRLSQLRHAIEKGYRVIITERCVHTDKMVFAQMLYDDNKIEEVNYKIYNKWFDEFIKDLPQFHYIYVKTTPKIAYNRVVKRSRKGEIGNIPFEYLEKCHTYHENWMSKILPHKKICFNGELDKDKDPVTRKKQVESVLNYIIQSVSTNNDDETYYTMMFDGGSRGNPGKSGCGFVIYQNEKALCEGSEYLGIHTNNYAEYMGLILGLKQANSLGIKKMIVKGDSLLVIKQLRGEYKVNSESLKILYEQAKIEISQLNDVSFHHVDRKFNKEADTLANYAMDNPSSPHLVHTNVVD